jgi:carboxypeptidase Q
MRQAVLTALLTVGALTALTVAPRSVNRGPYDQVISAALTGGGAYEFLRTLTETVGPRLTGSVQSRAASDLLFNSLQNAGLENIHTEAYPLRSRWQRGVADARIVSPIARAVLIQSFGWSPGTGGPVEAAVVDAGAVMSDTSLPLDVSGVSVLADFPGGPGEPGYATRARTARLLAARGAKALLIPSAKPDGLLDIGCFGNYPEAPLPLLSIAREDAAFVRHLLTRKPVRLSLRVENTLDRSPSVERNVIADLRGTSLPDRIILVGGHLDSWDTAPGAHDDGSGVAAVLEVARILQSVGVRGKRTIRFAFFSGEEQAILGSRAYVDAHEAELDRVDAVVIMDEGAGVPRGFRLHGRTDLETPLRRILQVLRPLGATGLSQQASFDQDHAYFLAAGVPALTLWVHPGDYETHHHATSDTLDTIDRHTLAIDTAVMAAAVLALADADAIGRRLVPSERVEMLRRTRLDASIAALDEPLRIATPH